MKIILPWKNLGCVGIMVKDFYIDLFFKPYLGFFLNYKGKIYRKGVYGR